MPDDSPPELQAKSTTAQRSRRLRRMLEEAIRLLAALPREPGRFLLAPALAGGRGLVGRGTPTVVAGPDAGLELLPALLEPGPRGTVVLLGYELGRSLIAGGGAR